MLSIYQCPVCGGRECTTSGDCARGCVSPIKTMVTVSDVWGDELARLTRERDEALARVAQLERWGYTMQADEYQQMCLSHAERERDCLRALLRELEWSSCGDCVRCAGCKRWQPQCPECGRCHTCGHAPDCRLKAALEGRDVAV